MLEKGPTPTGRTIMSNMGIDPDSFIGGIREGIRQIEQEEQTRVEIHFYHCDHLGTPIALTDRNGKIVWAARYEPWGNIEEEFNPYNIEQNIRLPGQHHDRETGLYYNRHRYYDPKIGAYINQDPIGLLGGVNFYRYPTNPLRGIDPRGLAKCYIPSPEVINAIAPTQTDNIVGTALDAASTSVRSSASSGASAGDAALALALGASVVAGRKECLEQQYDHFTGSKSEDPECEDNDGCALGGDGEPSGQVRQKPPGEQEKQNAQFREMNKRDKQAQPPTPISEKQRRDFLDRIPNADITKR
jgi:RHS repeat-associated protein